MLRCPVRQKPPPRKSPSTQEQLRPDVLPGGVSCSLQRASQQQLQAGGAEPSERFAHNHIFAIVIPAGVTSLADRMERGRWAGLGRPRKYPPIAAPRSRRVTRDVMTARTHSQRAATQWTVRRRFFKFSIPPGMKLEYGAGCVCCVHGNLTMILILLLIIIQFSL